MGSIAVENNKSIPLLNLIEGNIDNNQKSTPPLYFTSSPGSRHHLSKEKERGMGATLNLNYPPVTNANKNELPFGVSRLIPETEVSHNHNRFPESNSRKVIYGGGKGIKNTKNNNNNNNTNNITSRCNINKNKTYVWDGGPAHMGSTFHSEYTHNTHQRPSTSFRVISRSGFRTRPKNYNYTSNYSNATPPRQHAHTDINSEQGGSLEDQFTGGPLLFTQDSKIKAKKEFLEHVVALFTNDAIQRHFQVNYIYIYIYRNVG